MPTSTCEPVTAALRHALSSEGAPCGGALDNCLVGSAKRVILSHIDFEEPETYKASVLDTLKSKYIVLGAKQTNQMTPEANKEETLLPEPKQVLFPLDDVQLGWQDSNYGPGAGMVNTGNTCYLNSTLQALFHVPALVNWLLSDWTHRSSCDSCMVCAVAKTLIASQSSQSGQQPIKPWSVSSKLRIVCRHFVPGRQEDAHEFLRYLVEAMEKAYLERFRNSNLDVRSKETTPLNQILGGYLRSAVRCLECGHVSTTIQHFQDLMLDIRKVNTLDDALAAYFACERLDDLAYRCESCKRKVAAVKQFSLERAPCVLCVQLKRFAGAAGGKITKHITFRQRLELTSYTHQKPAQPLVYRLVALVTHMGMSANCGHYTAVAQSASGTFFEFDDGCVRPVSQQTVFNTNAYIMLYELERDSMQCPKEMTTVKGRIVPKNKSISISKSELSPVKAASSSAVSPSLSTASNSLRIVPGMISSQIQSKSSLVVATAFKNNLIPTPVRSSLFSNDENIKTYSNSTVTSEKKLNMPNLNSFDLLKNSNSNSLRVKTSIENSLISTQTTLNQTNTISINNKISNTTSSPNKLQNDIPADIKKALNGTSTTKTNGILCSPRKVKSMTPVTSTSNNDINTTNVESEKSTSQKIVVNGMSSSSGRKLVPYESDESSSSESEGTEAQSGHWSVSTRTEITPSLNGETGWRKTSRGSQDTTQEIVTHATNGNKNSNNSTVSELMRLSHVGYGSSVVSWTGGRSALDKEVAEERREHFKRQRHGDDIDAGRIKKVRHNGNNMQRSNSGYNPFQEYQNDNRRWQNCNNGSGPFLKNFYNTTSNRNRKHYFHNPRFRR